MAFGKITTLNQTNRHGHTVLLKMKKLAYKAAEQVMSRCKMITGTSRSKGDSMTTKTFAAAKQSTALPAGYAGIHGDIVELLNAGRLRRAINRATARIWRSSAF